MTDRERAAALADEICGADTRRGFDVHPSNIGLVIRALALMAATPSSERVAATAVFADLRAAAAAFFDEHHGIMDTMQAFAYAWEETEDPHENIRRKREAWRNAFLSCIDPLLIATGLASAGSVSATSVSADLRKIVARAIGEAVMAPAKPYSGPVNPSAIAAGWADAALAAISAAGYVICPREPTEPDILADFGKHKGWTLNYKCPFFADDDDTEQCWQVLEEFGGINDREWRVKGKGDTPADAIRAALATGASHEA